MQVPGDQVPVELVVRDLHSEDLVEEQDLDGEPLQGAGELAKEQDSRLRWPWTTHRGALPVLSMNA